MRRVASGADHGQGRVQGVLAGCKVAIIQGRGTGFQPFRLVGVHPGGPVPQLCRGHLPQVDQLQAFNATPDAGRAGKVGGLQGLRKRGLELFHLFLGLTRDAHLRSFGGTGGGTDAANVTLSEVGLVPFHVRKDFGRRTRIATNKGHRLVGRGRHLPGCQQTDKLCTFCPRHIGRGG